MNRTDVQKILDTFSSVFAAHCEFGCAFGSVLEPRFRPESDVDFAIFPKQDVGSTELETLRSRLEELIDRDVDCINLRDADPIVTMQVIQNGKLVFSQTKDQFDQFVARKLSEYIDFKRSREIVEKSLVQKPIIGES